MQKHLQIFKIISTKIILKYITAALVLMVILYPKFPFIRIPKTFVSVRLEDFLFLFAGLLLFSIILPKLRFFFQDRLNQNIFLFLLVGLISLLSGIFVTQTVTPHIGFLHWLRRVEYFIPLFLGIEFIKDSRKNLDFFVKVVLLAMFLVFFYGVGQKYFGWPMIITQNQEYSKGIALRYVEEGHINSTFAGHYDLATFLVLSLPIVVSLLVLLSGVKARLILFLAWVAGLWLLVNTASRISLASYLLSLTLTLLLIRRYKLIPVFLLMSLLFVGFSSNLLSRYARIFQITRERFLQINLQEIKNGVSPVLAQGEFPPKISRPSPTPTPIPVFEDRSTNIRLNVEWPRAIRALAKNPLFGTGYSSITLATDNDYLRLLGEVGLLGFLSFSLIFIRIFALFLKAFPFDKYFKDTLSMGFVSGLVGSFGGIFLNAVFIDVFEASKFASIFWLFLGVGLALISQKR